MALILNEDQEMLRGAARGFLNRRSPVSELRHVRDEAVAGGFSKDIWREMAEQGFAGVLIGEEHGGSAFGHVGAGVIAAEMGRTLAPSPFLSTAVLGASALAQGSAAQQQEYLPGIASGELLTALALDEGPKHRPARIAMTAEKSGNGFKLTGRKSFVPEGGAADLLIVAARTAGSEDEAEGVTLFLVPADADGVTPSVTPAVDSRNYAGIAFDGVKVDGGAVLGEIDQGQKTLKGVLAAGRAVLAAEMEGLSRQAFAMTVDYLKTRKQFGQSLGSFQGLQHRAAHLWMELELVESAVLKALQELDAGSDFAPIVASLAKSKAGSVARLATQEAVQMHGGIGIADEHDIGLYLKRARVADELLGDAAFHADQIARLRGY